MRETEKFRTERLVARPWQIEDLPLAMELWGDPAVTALIDSRGKLTNAQVGEKLRAEIDIAFLAYCLHVTLARRLHVLAPGLTPRSVLGRLAGGGNAIRTIGPSATVTSSWRALPSVAISSEATRIFPAQHHVQLVNVLQQPDP